MLKRVSLKKPEKWVPKKWKPIYDRLVMAQVSGLDNKEIAEIFGYTPQQISNILTCSEAQALREKISENVNDHVMESIDAKLKRITVRAVDNIEKVIFDDNILEKAPLAILDRSERFLRSIGKLRGDVSDNKVNNTVIISNDVAKLLAEGLNKANRVHELHQLKP